MSGEPLQGFGAFRSEEPGTRAGKGKAIRLSSPPQPLPRPETHCLQLCAPRSLGELQPTAPGFFLGFLGRTGWKGASPEQEGQFRGHCNDSGKWKEGSLGGTDLQVFEEMRAGELEADGVQCPSLSPSFLTGARSGRLWGPVPMQTQEGEQL